MEISLSLFVRVDLIPARWHYDAPKVTIGKVLLRSFPQEKNRNEALSSNGTGGSEKCARSIRGVRFRVGHTKSEGVAEFVIQRISRLLCLPNAGSMGEPRGG